MSTVRVGVLMGGRSCEKEVSFNSGRTICDYIDTRCYTVVPLFQTEKNELFILPWKFLHRGKITDFYDRLHTQAERITWDALKDIVDIIYIAQHGQFAEDGTMQGMLEVLNIPYIGSKVLASAIGMDKIFQKKILRAADILVPRDITIQAHGTINIATIEHHMHAQSISYPCVVKPYKEGSSKGVSIVHTQKELYDAIIKARMVNEKSQAVLIEEKINGMEFSCIVVYDLNTQTLKPLTPTEVAVDQSIGFYDYEQKYMPGKQMHFTPPRCSADDIILIQRAALKTAAVLEFKTIGRIDGFLTADKKIVITDPNSFSGAAPSSFLFKQATLAGFTHTTFINHLIKSELMQSSNKNILELNEQAIKAENEKKIKIGVIFGGLTSEKEISLESGRNVVLKLSPHAYEAIPLFLSSKNSLYRINYKQLVSSSTNEIENSLEENQHIPFAELPQIMDFAFIALHGGQGENGSLQGLLELLDIPYNGSGVIASALCMDKYKTKEFLASQGFDVPKGILINAESWHTDTATWNEKLNAYALPLIVKPHDDGCSTDVKRANNQKELYQYINEIFAKKRTHVLVEEFIEGTELTGGVIGNETAQALPPSQVVSTNDILSLEEKFLPGAGENRTPALLPEKAITYVKETLQKVYTSVGCKGYARIDCFYQNKEQSPTNKERVVIIEINTLPALTPATCLFHQAAEIGIQPMDFIDLIVHMGLQAHDILATDSTQ